MPPRKQITRAEILDQARKMYTDTSPDAIDWGLYLVKEFPALESYGSSSGQQAPRAKIPTPDWVVIHERIVTLDVAAAWDDLIEQRMTILETNTPATRPNASTPASQEQRKNSNEAATPSTSPVTPKHDWLPEGWKIVDALVGVRFLCSWGVIDLESRLQNRCRALQHSQPPRPDQRTVAPRAIANCPRPQSQ